MSNPVNQRLALRLRNPLDHSLVLLSLKVQLPDVPTLGCFPVRRKMTEMDILEKHPMILSERIPRDKDFQIVLRDPITQSLKETELITLTEAEAS